ncbi:DUF3082 domain-containing protein [Myxosarcina sp. GI1]|uniref:DUF3082 domain-containing protein n=1 Tax=Myxosarcina sp. GI1 TaxID=1541065 RepID=UPI00056A2BBF|nr:DUF3082 domain-containing protein [Myxosarcina sp. GI1]
MSENTPQNLSSAESPEKKITLLRCWTASILSGGLATAIYFLMMSIVQTYANKPVTSANPVVVNLTVAVRTLVIGMAALGTGVFGIVALGLFLLGIQVAIQNLQRRFSKKSG